MGTKSWQAFEGKIRVLKQHLQLLDLALALANNKATQSKDSGKTIREALGAKIGKHLQLNIPNKSKDISRIFITSRKKLNEHAIIELYRIYSDYIRNVIAEMMHKKPFLLIELLKMSELPSNKSRKEQKRYSIDAEDILKTGNFDSLVEKISMQLYRNLENERSNTKLLDKMINATHISIDETLKKDVLLYLEMRHIIVHNNSMADEKFFKMPNDGLVKINAQSKKIILNYETTNNAITKVFRLCKSIDNEFIRLIHGKKD